MITKKRFLSHKGESVKTVFIISGIVIACVAAFVLWMGMPKGPKLEQVAFLKQPRITTMKNERVLVVVAKGAPNVVAKKAFGLLMKTYFGLKGVPKGGPDFKAPRGRWPVDEGTPPDQWVGRYAMPLPDAAGVPAGVEEKDGMRVESATWEYGQVAEILHVGRYDREQPTIKALRDFIDQGGWRIVGEHEEEYLRGPGMIFAGNPGTYLTIIRYRIAKKDTVQKGL
jgi:hypothetical protein